MSLMDRTKRQALAARQQQVLDAPADGDDRDLEDMIRQTRERVKAAKAAKSRTAALRQELLDLQEEEQSIAASEDPAPPAAAADPGAFMAASLKSAVIYIFSLLFEYPLFIKLLLIFSLLTIFLSFPFTIINPYFDKNYLLLLSLLLNLTCLS